MRLPQNLSKISLALLVLALTYNIFFLLIDDCAHHVELPYFGFSVVISLFALVFWFITRKQIDKKKWVWGGISVLLFNLLGISCLIVLLSYTSECYPGSPEICMMPAGINCQKTYLSTDGTLNVTLVNGLQKTIHFVGMKCTQEIGPTDFEAQDISASMGQAFSPNDPLLCTDANGDSIVIGGNLASGQQYNGKLYVRYYFADEGSANIRTIVGTVTVRAQTPY